MVLAVDGQCTGQLTACIGQLLRQTLNHRIAADLRQRIGALGRYPGKKGLELYALALCLRQLTVQVTDLLREGTAIFAEIGDSGGLLKFSELAVGLLHPVANVIELARKPLRRSHNGIVAFAVAVLDESLC